MGTGSKAASSNVDDLSTLGELTICLHLTVDGMNVEAVHEARSEQPERAARGDGPTLLEIEELIVQRSLYV